MGWLGTLAGTALAPVTGGLSMGLSGEDTLSRIPVIGPMSGAKSDAQKALEKKQQELAREADLRRGQVRNAQMNQMTQRLAAFDPLNQRIAQQLGPGAAFRPEQFAQMAQDPMGAPKIDPSLIGYQGNDPKKRAMIDEWARRVQEFRQQEDARKQQLMGMQQPGPGPAPIQMAQPMAAKRY